jgi:hypothetical protein
MESHPDDTVPGGVYLCQVNDRVSCGACCGLYNVAEVSRTHLAALLHQRTLRFATLPRTAAAIDAFAQWTHAQESQKRPFADFHHCPFIGLIGPNASRVGCLLHPLAEGNQGVDFRGLSYYGGLACRTYFCPATQSLPARYKRILRTVLDDWYLYGMVVTETELIAAQFQWLEKRLGREMDAALWIDHPHARQPLVDLLALKISWPFRPHDAPTPCHYFFTDPPHIRPQIDYGRLGAVPSPMHPMLRELVSAFGSTADLHAAEQLLETKLERAARALVGGAHPTGPT